jgi:hypothetical protein
MPGLDELLKLEPHAYTDLHVLPQLRYCISFLDDVVVVVHIYLTSLKSTTKDRVTIRLQLPQIADQETKGLVVQTSCKLLHESLRFMPSI